MHEYRINHRFPRLFVNHFYKRTGTQSANTLAAHALRSGELCSNTIMK
jgi:hypothetical protein